jgi:hypothetical protein
MNKTYNNTENRVIQKPVTRVYNSYDDFLNRENKQDNGVSVAFDNEHPDYIDQNKTNMGCYDCIDCLHCKDCIRCTDCYDCVDCSDCSKCKRCLDCSSCNRCRECKRCTDCIGRKYCTDCSGDSHSGSCSNQ